MAFGIDPMLETRMAAALPKHARFTLHHVSSKPTPCPELFSAPPNQDPEVTVCESHFLSASIAHGGTQVHAFALEVLTYTTDTLTTLFVSKADSTGYLHLLESPKGTSSLLKTVISTFLSYLVEIKCRTDRRLVLSLFARAQDQYLFPGSIENSSKHVLDDRGLIKWWCKIFDSILQEYSTAKTSTRSQQRNSSQRSSSQPLEPSARAYLVVPGCDKHETRAFFPRANPPSPPRWLATDPLRSLGKPAGIPERCLIPRFPDDPKARFVVDLDDELPENGPQPQDSPAKNPHLGKWRSVRSLEQFWELMSFRQECSAGRLVGFLWAVFEPPELQDRPFESRVEQDDESSSDTLEARVILTDFKDSIADGALNQATPLSRPASPPPEPPLAPLPSSQLELPDSQLSTSTIPPLKLPETEQEGLDPSPPLATTTHGDLALVEDAYKRAIDLLLNLDYANLALAVESTQKFTSSVAEAAKISAWGLEIVGKKEETTQVPHVATDESGSAPDVAVLSAGLVRRKKRPIPDTDADGAKNEVIEDGKEVIQVLSTGLMRKKPKV